MQSADVRQWVDARRSLEAYERQSAGPAPPPDVAWRQAVALLALLGRMVGWPVLPDEIRRREDAAAADAWLRLRANYRRCP
jgi:hypothetical protein